MNKQSLLAHARHLLAQAPNLSEYAQAERSIQKKGSSSQLSFLKEERKRKQQSFLRLYDSWYEQAYLLVEQQSPDLLSQLKQTKISLDYQQRIQAAVQLLEQIPESDTPSQSQREDIQGLIAQGESDTLEFKSSLRWDYRQNALNKQLHIPILKTLAAFLNSKGGTLLIGVNDQGEILGLERDYPTLRKQDGDGFIQYLLQMINFHLGKALNHFLTITIENTTGKEVCQVIVEPSDKPVFLSYDNKEEFYIRASVSSQPLNVREATEYINMRWK